MAHPRSPENPFPDPDEAMAYLSGFPNLPEWPEPEGLTDAITGLHLARAMEQLPRDQRFKNGTAQSNAHHSWRLRLISVNIAEAERQEIDASEVGTMCEGHDMHELYCGDTPIRDTTLLETKENRERAGLAIFIVNELVKNPQRQRTMERYHAGKTPEAKLVKAMDKVEPILFDIENDGETYRHHGDQFPWLVRTQLPKTIIDPSAFKLMVKNLVVVGLRWDDWKCKPFDGDPEELVYSLRDELVRHKPDLRDGSFGLPLA